ncbi:hypothetical protein CEUSTIGMA_g9521.t1 [Chlamydomonas eustigma]|uniref:Mitochondrial import inner membrane translocase subunit n=1 Tax=Chlamydomonas eustigma TaxID=1157962 RepID=A0A250XGB2_9CHLO|nr:hypothetical protein CEUSTIGMA_g9521.t1 [Chlamydomonas eustigma]|eukprot:GAX82093.1 hypothetical protein CEUSTIGMA_g9521.t1 [Chlamydomonas eustigma]
MNFPLEGAVTEMSAENKQMLAASLEHMQVRDSLKMYNNLVERCFRECAEDMRSKALSSTEEKCVAKCVEKFMNLTGRVGQRFGEFYAEMEKQANEHMQELMKQQAAGK